MMNRKMVYVLLVVMLLVPVALTVVNAQDEPEATEEAADPYYEACGEVEPFKDPSNQHSLPSVKENIGFVTEDIQKLKAGTPTAEALDQLSQKMESSCLAAATLKDEDRKALSPQFKDLTLHYDELMTKVQEMEIPQTGSDE